MLLSSFNVWTMKKNKDDPYRIIPAYNYNGERYSVYITSKSVSPCFVSRAYKRILFVNARMI